MTDMLQLILPMNGKLHMGFHMTCSHLALAHSIGECQGHAHLDIEYLVNYDIYIR